MNRRTFLGTVGRVAMTVNGHNIRSVFDRCHIASPGEFHDEACRFTGTISSTVTARTTDPRLTRLS